MIMSSPTSNQSASIVDILRAHRAELEAMGVRHVALFGSQARGEATASSDIDLGVEFDTTIRTQALGYFGARQRVQDRLSTLLGVPVDVSDETMQRPLVRENYRTERLYAF